MNRPRVTRGGWGPPARGFAATATRSIAWPRSWSRRRASTTMRSRGGDAGKIRDAGESRGRGSARVGSRALSWSWAGRGTARAAALTHGCSRADRRRKRCQRIAAQRRAAQIDPAAAAALGRGYALGHAGPGGTHGVIRRRSLRAEALARAFRRGDRGGLEGAGYRANYGLSPGDDEHPEPYLYLGPWRGKPLGELWHAQGSPGRSSTTPRWRVCGSGLAGARARPRPQGGPPTKWRVEVSENGINDTASSDHRVLDSNELPERRVTTVTARTAGRASSTTKASSPRSTTTARIGAARWGRARSRTGCCAAPGTDRLRPGDRGDHPGSTTRRPCYPLEMRDDGVCVGSSRRAEHGRTVTDAMAETIVDMGRRARLRHGRALQPRPRRRDAPPKEAGNLAYIGIRHEGAAAFAASAYGKLTGEPAACLGSPVPAPQTCSPAYGTPRSTARPSWRSPARLRTQVLRPRRFQEIDAREAFGGGRRWSPAGPAIAPSRPS